jgi:hypothetical protein
MMTNVTHAHCVLDIMVRWYDGSNNPSSGKEYLMTLKQTPASYGFMPEFVVKNGLEKYQYDAGTEYYSSDNQKGINYIPTVSKDKQSIHVIHGSVNSTKTGNALYGQFITFRYRSDSEVLFCVYSPDGDRLMKEIDLSVFFKSMGIDLDYSLCQEYSLLIDVKGDNVQVSFIEIGDWKDGGGFW